MPFSEFVEAYLEDMESRLKDSTMITKRFIVELKILPYFRDMMLNNIKASTIRKWQNTLIKKGFSETYLSQINNQMSAIMNHAVRFYDLKSNPCRKAGSMGKSNSDDMLFWTKDEFETFIEHVMNKQVSYLTFTTLYWMGIRIGELLVLTAEDYDVKKQTIRINKSYH